MLAYLLDCVFACGAYIEITLGCSTVEYRLSIRVRKVRKVNVWFNDCEMNNFVAFVVRGGVKRKNMCKII